MYVHLLKISTNPPLDLKKHISKCYIIFGERRCLKCKLTLFAYMARGPILVDLARKCAQCLQLQYSRQQD